MENQQLTATDKTPEEIQAEMSKTREALTEKVAALENQVVGSVQTAADTLTDTVNSVKSIITTAPGAVGDTVKQAAAAVSETVKESFDISSRVREHPWVSVGASALLGCMAAWLISGRRSVPSGAVAMPGHGPATPLAAHVPTSSVPPATPARPGVFDDLVSLVGRKIRELTENLIDTAAKSMNETVRDEVPKLVNAATGKVADRLAPASGAVCEQTRFAG